MSDFWKEYGEGYKLFSQLFRHDEWQTILIRIAREIENRTNSSSLSILDIGCGYGINSLSILQIVYTSKKIRHILDVIEPSQEAVFILKNIIPSVKIGGFLRDIYSDISHIINSEKKYNFVIIMHSSYYIDNFNLVLRELIRKNIKKGGLALILALTDTSPFFLGFPKLFLPYTSTRIKSYLQSENIHYTSYLLRSNFSPPKGSSLPKMGIDKLYRFFTRGNITRDDFISALKKIWEKDTNFEDELIVVKK